MRVAKERATSTKSRASHDLGAGNISRLRGFVASGQQETDGSLPASVK